mgnify:CR=1 FL=1
MVKMLALLCVLPCSVASQEFLTPEAFEKLSEGKTLYFAQQGQPYGTEQYLPNRQSIWQFADGACTKGIWFSRDQLICFVYENAPDEQCWNFLKKEKTYAARALGREPDADLDVIWLDDRPIACIGPDVGA